MVTVPATEIQKNFGEWHDRSFEEPVEITKYGRTSAYLISASLFKEMWASYRRAAPVSALSEDDVNLILRSEVMTGQPYNLDDLPEERADLSITPKR
ncbi:type II toxin-antitoxin system prevent-host-death family antitoxin [Brucella sp. IR073]|uniref:type II toxin-antitoxin system prevent-host-death family antitoxin n=1 Tax=unclassified Brucella TaxID=2632610 RepID=UPI003B987D1A